MTTLKTLTIAATLAALPAFASAEGCNYGTKHQEAQSCAAGSTMDASTGTCVPVVNS